MMEKNKSGLKDETRELLLADLSLREPPPGALPEACALRDAVLQALDPAPGPEQNAFLLDDVLLRKKTTAIQADRRVPGRLLAMAAAIVILLGSGILWQMGIFSPSVSFKITGLQGTIAIRQGEQNVSVAAGEPLTAPFVIRQTPASAADFTAPGTSVRLFGETELSVDVCRGNRAGFTLRRGSAAFTVEKDHYRQYAVHLGGTIIKVTGTQFALSRVGETGLVVVKTGTVQVIVAGKSGFVHSLSSGNGLVVVSGAVSFRRDFRKEPVFQALARQLDRIDQPLSGNIPREKKPGIPELSERIHLRDGSVLEGRIVSFDARTVVVETPAGMTVLGADRVVRIEYR